ncbi:TPA: hypothetical protein DGT35_02115 [Patescibacteria group bacterium]|nr:hypothetical protein [Patescibacteria group bacterium]
MNEEIKKIIEENPLALATINKKGEPDIIAVASVKLKDNKIIITDNYMKTTIENIEYNPNISLVGWNKKMEGYNIRGIAEYFIKGAWIDYVKSIPENKDEPCKGAIVIEIKQYKKSK